MAISAIDSFLLRRLHSLTGVVPVGVFLVLHLWTNARALAGEDAYVRGVLEIQAIPFLPLVEVAGIGAPLAFHAGYGVVLALRGRPNVAAYPYAHNWLYVLQRASGFVALAFIALHLWEYRVQKAFYGMQTEAFYGALSANLSSTAWGVPFVALAYLLGTAATVFHFANGLWGFCATWGLTTSRSAQRRSAWLFGALGAILFFVGASTVVHFATGSLTSTPHESP